MSDTNRVAMKFVKESTFGTTPGSPTMKTVRLTGESLKQATQTTKSQEIRNDRQIPDVVRTGINVEGDVNFELSPGGSGTDGPFDDWIASAVQASAWVADVVSTGSYAVGSSTTITRASGSFVTDGLVAGTWVKTSGFVNAVNNTILRVVTVAALTLTVSGVTLTTESAVSATIRAGGTATNGTTQDSYTIQKGFTDVANEFEYNRGCVIGGMSLAVSADAIITGSFSFLGKSQASGTTDLASSTTTAAANDVFNAIDHVLAVFEGGLTAADVATVTDFTFQLNNGLRDRQVVGTLGAQSIGSGTCDVSGTLQAYFTSKTILDKYLNFTKTNLSIVIRSSTNTGYVVDLPAVKFSDGGRTAGGQNDDVMADLSFVAYRDATLGYTVRVTRFTT